jgi:hypothetical protein
VTHRPEFSRGFTGALRPGLLVTVTDGGADYPILFLHLKAADEPLDLGVRVFQHDKAQVENVRFIPTLLRSPATMKFAGWDVSLDDEKSRIKAMYESQFDRMRMLPKSAPATFWNGPGSTDDPSDIDHVLAASQISFDQDPSGAEVEVLGWPEEPTDAAKQAWITRYSDHALIRFTVTGVN